jgi:hypothetical protein
MTTLDELEDAVEAAFARSARGLPGWPDPHPDRAPLDEEYSRALDPGKWRIVSARAQAWCTAAVELGVARLETDVDVRWDRDRSGTCGRTDRLVPFVGGGVPLVLDHFAWECDEPNAVTIGVGDPAHAIGAVPGCGCDACDSGSQDALDEIDEVIRGVVAGRLRHLRRGEQTVVTLGTRGWSTNLADPDGYDVALADPTGWTEITGPSWLATT